MYPGIWAVVAGSGWWVRARLKQWRPPMIRRAAAWAGVPALWLTLDWPLGPLGTGYLASAHALQFMLLIFLVPPLFLAALDRSRFPEDVSRVPFAGRLATQPLLGGVTVTVVIVATHMPAVVDGLMRFELGAFALDSSWLGAGLLLWWPVVVRRPTRRWFNGLVCALYVFLSTQVHLLVGMWLLTADFPVYSTYELAPRVFRLAALEDQRVAGAIMAGIAEPVVLSVITVVIFGWFAEQERQGSVSMDS